MAHTYEYPRPALTVDCVVFGLDDGELKILLIERAAEPFAGGWALPGGFVEMNETLEEAALRELEEETSMRCNYLEQLYTYGAVQRDPRERIVSVAYFALVKLSRHRIAAATDARNACWFALTDTPSLAFDHDEILDMAVQRLRNKIRYQPVGFELLPAKFTLRDLQHLYESVLDRSLDKRNFRKKILSTGLLVELNEVEQDVAHRAARLYRFDKRKYQKLSQRGFNFEI